MSEHRNKNGKLSYNGCIRIEGMNNTECSWNASHINEDIIATNVFPLYGGIWEGDISATPCITGWQGKTVSKVQTWVDFCFVHFALIP